MSTFRIGQVSTATGVSVRAICHYDQLGLLTTTRSENRYRVFQPEDIDRVQLIQLFLSIGFSLDEIGRWAPCFAGQRSPAEQPGAEMAAFYQRKLDALDAQLAALQRLRGRLAAQAARFGEPPHRAASPQG